MKMCVLRSKAVAEQGNGEIETEEPGRWSIDSGSMREEDHIDEELPGYFEFGPR